MTNANDGHAAVSVASTALPAQSTNMSKADMLKKAREAMADKKPEGNTFKVENLKDQKNEYDQDALPENPILHFQGNSGCHFSVAEGTSMIKLLVEDCKDCTIMLPKGMRLVTSVVEMWSCENVHFQSQIEIGTLQLDISRSLKISFAEVKQLGQMVQAGVEHLEVEFHNDSARNFKSGTTLIRETICPDLNPDDRTTQFITRLIDGQILTEEIIRLSNDFPTTLREKAKHDEQIKAKEAALTTMAQNMVSGVGKALGEKETKKIQEQVDIAKQKNQEELSRDVGESARADYRRMLGNEQFKIGEFQQAAVHYTEALDLDSTNAAVWANRAMCWLKLANPQRALTDCDKCLELDPKYTKAHFRRGVALLKMDKYVDACLSFRTTLDLDPKNGQARSSIMLAEKKMSVLNR